MKTFLKKDFRSILFVASLTLAGFTIGYVIRYELTYFKALGAILVIVASILTAISVGISISKSSKDNNATT